MRNVRFVVLGIVAAMIVLTLVFAPNSSNEIEDIKPYIQEIALRDGMGMMTSSELKRDFGISSEELEGFVLYGSEVDGDVREVLVVKTSGRNEAKALRRELAIRLDSQLEGLGSETGKLSSTAVSETGKSANSTASETDKSANSTASETDKTTDTANSDTGVTSGSAVSGTGSSKNLTDSDEAKLLRKGKVISRGCFVLYSVSNDTDEIVSAFSQSVRR